MLCPECSRELKSDSRYCDACGCYVGAEAPEEKSQLDLKTLIFSVAGSIIFSLFVMSIAILFKLPILFGGLFLPFFFKKKSKGNN